MRLARTLLALLLVYTTAVCAATVTAPQKPQKLLLLLLDGVRWDYLQHEGLGDGGFRRVMREGVRAEYLQPDFPTKSYPNYYSIMTGLHTESHGMVGNYMYDVERNQSFLIGRNRDQFNSHWWDGGDPLWVTAVRQNKRAFLYQWPGCEVVIRGLSPTFCRNYSKVPSISDTQEVINQAVDRLHRDQADVAGVYVEILDKSGHNYGPLTDRVQYYLEKTDQQIAHVLAELDRRGLRDEVNLMIFSDHGMTSVSPKRTIDLTRKLTSDIRKYMEGGPILFIWPKPRKQDIVFRSLVNVHPHMTVYFKHNIPDKWHLRHGRLTPPILAVADLGWHILTPFNPHFPADGNTMDPIQGQHGYDNDAPDMRGIFLAVGPAFRRDYITKPLSVVDLYQVMCSILAITPSPNNGSWAKVAPMMSHTFLNSSSVLKHNYLCHIFILIFAFIRWYLF